MKTSPWWIKERCNPQLGVYYVALGQLSKTAAKKQERSIYGENIMHRFETVQAYETRLAELKSEGARVQ